MKWKRTHQQIPEPPLQPKRKHLFAIDRNCLLPSSSSLQIQQQNKRNKKPVQAQTETQKLSQMFFFFCFAWTDMLSFLSSLFSSVLRRSKEWERREDRWKKARKKETFKQILHPLSLYFLFFEKTNTMPPYVACSLCRWKIVPLFYYFLLI